MTVASITVAVPVVAFGTLPPAYALAVDKLLKEALFPSGSSPRTAAAEILYLNGLVM